MSLQFEQSEVEGELNSILDHGDKIAIARITGIHESSIKQQFNPDDERKSAAFVFLQIQCAEDEISEERGEKFLQAVLRFRELSKKRQTNNNPCVGHETGNLNREVADVVNAHLQGKSFYDQLKEVDEAEAQLKRTKQAIMCAIDKERELLRNAYGLGAK